MTSNERLQKAFELSEFSRKLFLRCLRERFPGLPYNALMRIYLERLNNCHNKNYLNKLYKR